MYRTLVADDDFLVRSYLKTLDSWGKAGYEIVNDAEDGEEAYNFLRKEKVDVLVTDLSMPGNGWNRADQKDQGRKQGDLHYCAQLPR